MEKQQIIGVVILIILSIMILSFAETINSTPIIETMKIAEVNFEVSDDFINMQNTSITKMSIGNTEDIKQSSENEIIENFKNNVNKRSDKLIITRGGNLKSRIADIKPVEEIAKEVLDGKYGNGIERKKNLETLGYNYKEIQKQIDIFSTNKYSQQSNNPEIINSSNSSNEIITAYPHSTFKSYMAWTALSSGSPQGKLCAKAIKDNNTAILMYEGRYLVALGKAYAGNIGEKIDVVMENGNIIPVMVGDWKANADTDQYNSTTTHDGSIIEFIVSSNKDAAQAVNKSGNYNVIFPGKIKEFRK